VKHCLCIRYDDLASLAKRILAEDRNAAQVEGILRQRQAELDQMEEMWGRKNKALTDNRDLQVAGCLLKY